MREEEVDFETLLIAKVVEFLAAAGVLLGFDDFRGDEALEDGAEEGRSLQFGLGTYAEEIAGESGIGDIDAR